MNAEDERLVARKPQRGALARETAAVAVGRERRELGGEALATPGEQAGFAENAQVVRHSGLAEPEWGLELTAAGRLVSSFMMTASPVGQ